MKLTVENTIEIAKKYNFVYVEELNEILIPHTFRIDDDDWSFLRFVTDNDGLVYNCAYEFGITALENGKFGYHTSTFKNITTTEEFDENIKNFLSFIELLKPLENKYAEQLKLNKIGGDF